MSEDEEEKLAVDRASLLFALLMQEGFLLFIAGVWAAVRGLEIFEGAYLDPYSLGIIAGATLLLISLSVVVVLSTDALKQSLQIVDGLILRHLEKRDMVWIAIVSGFAEEVFFRGIIQHEFDIITASILFALMHIPNRKFWVYGLWALFAGFFLGNLYQWTGNLWVPIGVHILNNLIALLAWQRYRHHFLPKETPAPNPDKSD